MATATYNRNYIANELGKNIRIVHLPFRKFGSKTPAPPTAKAKAFSIVLFDSSTPFASQIR